jgi:hypothetical protein
MPPTAKQTSHWALRWLLRPERRLALHVASISTHTLHATRRSLLRKLSRHFAKEHCAQS